MRDNLGVINHLEGVSIVISKIALVFMMVLITANSLGRYVFNSPITGVREFVSTFLMVILVYQGASWLEHADGNIKVTILTDRFPSIEYLGITVAYPILIIILSAVVWEFANTALNTFSSMASTTGTISFPVFISWVSGCFGLTLLIIRLVQKWIDATFSLSTHYREGETWLN